VPRSHHSFGGPQRSSAPRWPAVIATAVACLLSGPALGQRSDQFNAGVTYQTIDHFAAHDSWTGQVYGAWSPARRAAISDALFDRESGIGLSGWYYHLGAGTDATIAARSYPWRLRTQESFQVAPGQYDWSRNAATGNLLADALSRGVERTMMVVYSPPLSLTNSGRPYPSSSGDNLAAGAEQQFASYLADVLEHFRDHPDPAQRVEFDYISPVNEPEYDWSGGGQEGNGRIGTSTIRNRYLAPLASALDARGLATGIRAPESAKIQSLSSGQNYLRNLAGNATVSGSLGNVLTYHSYFSDNDANMLPRRQEAAAAMAAYPDWELWQTEYCILFGDASSGLAGNGNDTTMTTALAVARTIHFDLTVANASAWSYWLAATPWEHNYKDGLIYFNNASQTFQVAKVGWALGHYSRFIRPGAERIAFAGPNDDIAGLLTSGWRHDETGDLTLVYTNQLRSPQSVLPVVSSAAGLKADYFTPYRTTDTVGDDLRELAPVLAGQPHVLPARSMTTLVGGTFAEDNTGKQIATLAGGRDYTLGAGMLTLLDGAGSYDGRLAGAGGFRKLGTGTLTLTARSSHAGGTLVGAGTLAITAADGDGSAVGTGPLTIEAGARVLAGENAFGRTPETPVTIRGGILHQQTGSSQLGAVTFQAGTLSGVTGTSVGLEGTVTSLPAATTAEIMVPAVRIDGSVAFEIGDGPAAVDLRIRSPLSGERGFQKAGDGTLELLGAGSFTGPTFVTAGTLRLGHARGLAESRLVIASAGRVELAGQIAAVVPELIVDGGGLDLGRGRLTIESGASEAVLRALILAGRDGSASAGILSSAAAALGDRATVGYRFDGAGRATVAFAPVGDANLDGEVNLFDLVTSEASGRYGAGGAAGWDDGDFNYDGKFNVFDLLAIETSGTYAAGPLSIAAVPEPALGWIAAAAASAGLYRRLASSSRSFRTQR
jgi:autotransporter-associated beta strand protein